MKFFNWNFVDTFIGICVLSRLKESLKSLGPAFKSRIIFLSSSSSAMLLICLLSNSASTSLYQSVEICALILSVDNLYC